MQKPAFPSAMIAILAACFFMATAAAVQAENAGVFRAGASAVDVTPLKFPVRVNAMFTERTATQAVDRLYARSVVLEKRESASRPHQGIVRFRTEGYYQEGTVVIDFKRTILVYKAGHVPAAPRRGA